MHFYLCTCVFACWAFGIILKRSKIKLSSSSWSPFEDNWRKISNSQTVCWNILKIKIVFQHIFIGRKHKKWQCVQKSFRWFMHPLTVHSPCLCFENDKYDWVILDIILKDLKTLILYWRTWKPWYYLEGHENLDIILKDMETLILYWRTWKPAKFNWKCYFAGEQQREAPPCFSREGSFSILSNFPFCIAAFFLF